MFSITAPSTSSAAAFEAAVNSIRDRSRQASFRSVASEVESRCNHFDLLANACRLGDAKAADFIVAGIDSREMVNLYDDQFSQNDGTRVIRDAIKNASPGGVCPYCGQGTVYQLDHYLPKSAFPGTSVHPSNLVPACADCNFEKKHHRPNGPQDAILHPYFDPIISVRWLYASIALSAGGPPVVLFHVTHPRASPVLRARLEKHLDVLKLQRRFSQWAAQVLEGFQALLASDLGDSMSLSDAVAHLRRSAIQQSGGRVNSWEYATYQAMAEDEVYLRTYLGLR